MIFGVTDQERYDSFYDDFVTSDTESNAQNESPKESIDTTGLSLTELDNATTRAIVEMVRNGEKEAVKARFSDEPLSREQLTPQITSILIALVRNGEASFVLSHINLSTFQAENAQPQISKLISELLEYDEDLTFVGDLDVSLLAMDVTEENSFSQKNLAEKILIKLKSQQDTDYIIEFLKKNPKVVNAIPDNSSLLMSTLLNINTQRISTQELKVLLQVEPYSHLDLDEFTLDDIKLWKEGNYSFGPTQDDLAEVIKQLATPVDGDYRGWEKFNLDKNGSTTDIFVQNQDFLSAIFRCKDIPSESIAILEKLRKIIPWHVPCKSYPELTGNEKDEAFWQRFVTAGFGGGSTDSHSFREVYLGADFNNIAKYNYPPALLESIQKQKKLIIAILELYGLKHGHAHFGNFNARFLLANGTKTEKKVLFDLNQAVKLIEDGEYSTITPIVALRDFDQSHQSDIPRDRTTLSFRE